MKLSFQQLRLVFFHDSTSPSGLSWACDIHSGNGKLQAKRGTPAGTLGKAGYWIVKYKSIKYASHRIIWEIYNGSIPEGFQIDHINRVRSDNSLSNLRVVSHAVNSRNQCRRITNNTGVTGVSKIFYKSGEIKYLVRWMDLKGKQKAKVFSDLAEAAKFRNLMIFEMNKQGAGYSPSHGK